MLAPTVLLRCLVGVLRLQGVGAGGGEAEDLPARAERIRGVVQGGGEHVHGLLQPMGA